MSLEPDRGHHEPCYRHLDTPRYGGVDGVRETPVNHVVKPDTPRRTTAGRGIVLASTSFDGIDPWDAAVHLALGLGLRREEVLGLRWSDVDDAVHIRQTLTAAESELHFGPPKSKAGRRDLPMPGFVSRALGRHRLAQAERFLGLGLPRPELVITNAIGEPYQPASFSGEWRDFAEVHGFAGITFHGLRHGAATLLLAAGVPDTVVMRTMGHGTRGSSPAIRTS